MLGIRLRIPRSSCRPRAELRINDTVTIRNCPPISARKRFTLEKIVKSPETERDLRHAQQAEALRAAQIADSAAGAEATTRS